MSEIIEGWVVLETVSYEHQAEMIRSQLEEAGIDCTVYSQKDTVNVVFVGDLSEIKILVHQDKLAEAREVIKDIELPDMEISEDADVGEGELARIGDMHGAEQPGGRDPRLFDLPENGIAIRHLGRIGQNPGIERRILGLNARQDALAIAGVSAFGTGR